MILSRFSVQHYKSLDDVWLSDLGQITLIVGNNATGKSNIVDAFRFFRDTVVDGLDHAFSIRGGIGTIRQYSPTKPYLIHIEAVINQEIEVDDERTETKEALYNLRIMSLKEGNYRIEHEQARWYEENIDYECDGEGNPTSRKHAKPLEHSVTRDASGAVSGSSEDSSRKLSSDQIILRSGQFNSGSWNLGSIIGSMRFSALYPNTLRAPSRPDTDRRLKENGENWASVLKAMKSNERGRRRFEVILQFMKRVMPGLSDVRVQSVGGYLVPKFVVQDAPGSKEHDFDPVQLSDGTLRVFGILLALYQLPAPKFLAIEEPELTVNPGILAVLAEAFHDVSNVTQLLVTTHSPELIDFFQPDSIRVATWQEGRTIVSSIKDSQIQSIKEHLTTVGELLQKGNLKSVASDQ